jgi:hypothetical protein
MKNINYYKCVSLSYKYLPQREYQMLDDAMDTFEKYAFISSIYKDGVIIYQMLDHKDKILIERTKNYFPVLYSILKDAMENNVRYIDFYKYQEINSNLKCYEIFNWEIYEQKTNN